MLLPFAADGFVSGMGVCARALLAPLCDEVKGESEAKVADGVEVATDSREGALVNKADEKGVWKTNIKHSLYQLAAFYNQELSATPPGAREQANCIID